jgi:uncharacterized protein YjbI with pentapeptide repeats
MASRLWQFLTTDVSELFSIDAVNITADKAGAIFGLAEILQKEGFKVEELAPLVNQLDSLLDVLNSPLAEIVEKSLPFVSIATGLLKFYLEKSKKKLTLANCVALVSQAAYLESFKTLLQDKTLLQQIGRVPVSENVTQQTRQLAELELSDEEARKAVTSFPRSALAKTFGQVLYTRLAQAGLCEEVAKRLTERVTWFTPRYMNMAWAASAEAVKYLGQPTFNDWRQEQAKYQDIDDYLGEVIQPEPDEKVFNEESLTFRAIYVPMEIQRLDQQGKPLGDESLYDLEAWVNHHLMKVDEKPSILFIQGEAGRGKSVFCRMFADWVRKSLYPAYIPVLIRLRQIKTLETSLTQSLANCLETRDFVRSDPGWLTDDSTRFLFLLDGFDELLMEGRESGGLKEFLQQVEQFQKDSHHRFLITGRPLSLQGIERLISQTRGLERVELQPMRDALRERWYQQWAAKFGQAETDNFKHFLSVCPKDVYDSLAREPLLLYLLGRMHREQQLRADMFIGTEGLDAKIVIYDEAVRWVIQEQRQDENFRLAGLESEDLRHVLMEAAVCVVQSGNEVAKVSFLEARLAQDTNSRVYELLQEARKTVTVSEKKLLNNLLTTFYIKPASGDREGSVEFAHKSFGEFLFAERLKDALEDWSKKGTRRGEKYLVPNGEMWKEMYDLLGYGSLTREIVDYLKGLLTKHGDFDPIQLFERLHDAYLRWWSGEFIDALSNNLPQDKMRCLREQIPEREASLGLRQVDAYTGFNIMILLFELHRYGQSRDDLQEELTFHPCGNPDTGEFDKDRLFRIIGYGECLSIVGFSRCVAPYLRNANLRGATLRSANLRGANLRSAVLHGATLSGANLNSADLILADLSGATLFSADLYGADLYGADLSSAILNGADLILADLSGANLSNANLSNANLNGANLYGADLYGANLYAADLYCADLSSADLSSANLSSANLSSADLANADLSAIKWDQRTRWANAKGLHEARGIPAELAQKTEFIAAVILSKGISYAEKAEIHRAIEAYNQSETIDPTIEISAYSWNILCKMGSRNGYATDVLFAGEKAVNLSPEYKGYQDNRGLAKALAGDLDGALIDFQSVLDSDALSGSEKARREYWVKVLQSGENPFTPQELESLREAMEKS